jgi:hypothetical protein
MSATSQELQSFYQFATQRLRDVGDDETLDDLFVEWRASHATPEELQPPPKNCKPMFSPSGRPFAIWMLVNMAGRSKIL